MPDSKVPFLTWIIHSHRYRVNKTQWGQASVPAPNLLALDCKRQ